MDPHRPPYRRPNRLRAPVRRSDQALVLWPRRLAWALVLAVGLFVGVARVVALVGRHRVGLLDLVGIAFGVAMLAVGVWLVVTSRPVLVVDEQGVSAPLRRQPVPIAWPRIAGFRHGAKVMNSTLEVVVWADRVGNDGPPAGQVALIVPTLLLPARRKQLAADIERYRPIEAPDLQA